MVTVLSLMSPRGRFAALTLAAALVVPSGLAAAGAASAHQECEREAHSCGTAALVAPCCCHAGAADRSASAATTGGRQTLTEWHGPLVMASAFLVVPTDVDGVSSAVLRMHAPPHGYYRADLSLLLSTLLI